MVNMGYFLTLITNLVSVFEIPQCLASYGLKTIFCVDERFSFEKASKSKWLIRNESPFKALSFSF
jgi:hypothetical protein